MAPRAMQLSWQPDGPVPVPVPVPVKDGDKGVVVIGSGTTCDRCVELEAQLEKVQLAKEDDAFNFAVDISRKNQEIGRLKKQLDEFLDETPGSKLAKRIFTYWVERCGKSARTVYGTARKKAILSALKQHDEETIKRAIDGAALKPFVGPRGRQETNANGAKRFDDLTLILRDETTIERFGGYAQ